MCIEIAFAGSAAEVVESQKRFIADQTAIGVPSQHLCIRCPCLRKVQWGQMYKCLYCEMWLCRKCAEEHFGKTVEQYKADRQQEETA
jgi:hypothetical protein